MDKQAALKQVFGHAGFRAGQEQLIDALLGGRDVLGVMPTGAGKSVCYQIPALLLDGVTLVVSPLISLMKDQVAALSQAGVPAAYINSSLTAAQYREVFRRASEGRYKVIYVAPERLATADFLRFASGGRVALVAVDEAHCVSQWGQDFRPSYLKIPEFIGRLPFRPTVGAFTATATAAVREDIVRLLRLRTPLSLTTGFDRPNLYFDVVRPKSKPAYLLDYVRRNRAKSGIVYCATRAAVERVCDELRQHGIGATRYHAGLEDAERLKNQEDFVYDRRRVMAATNAFGMGIDKSNVGYVLHYNMPKNLESYYQEAGRAGRDGEPADCILMFSKGDIRTAQFLIQNAEENAELTAEERETFFRLDMERLDKMVGYCQAGGCFRSYILEYFGEKPAGGCHNCGNCAGSFTEQDITVAAQKILSGVARAEKKHPYGLGVTLIVRMLHGSGERRITQLGLDRLPTYGIMRGVEQSKIREYIDHLAAAGYLEQTGGEFPVLRLKDAAGDVLFRGKRVLMTVRETPASEKPLPARIKGRPAGDLRIGSDAEAAVPEDLLSALKALRARLAQAEKVPAYIVFSNAALSDMAAKRPATIAEFLEVSGVGEVKAARYGKEFLNAIREYVNGEED